MRVSTPSPAAAGRGDAASAPRASEKHAARMITTSRRPSRPVDFGIKSPPKPPASNEPFTVVYPLRRAALTPHPFSAEALEVERRRDKIAAWVVLTFMTTGFFADRPRVQAERSLADLERMGEREDRSRPRPDEW